MKTKTIIFAAFFLFASCKKETLELMPFRNESILTIGNAFPTNAIETTTATIEEDTLNLTVYGNEGFDLHWNGMYVQTLPRKVLMIPYGDSNTNVVSMAKFDLTAIQDPSEDSLTVIIDGQNPISLVYRY